MFFSVAMKLFYYFLYYSSFIEHEYLHENDFRESFIKKKWYSFWLFTIGLSFNKTFSVRRVVETLISPVHAHDVNDNIKYYINLFVFLTLFLHG